MAIAAVGVVLQLRKQSSDLQLEHLKYESGWIIGVLGDILGNKGQSPDYSSLSNLTLGSLNSIPPAYLNTSVIGVTTVTNGFGGQIYVGPMSLDGVNNAYALTYTGVPRDVCSKFVVMLHAGANGQKIPTYSVLGQTGVSTAVPLTSLGVLNGTLVTPIGTTILQYAGVADLDLKKLAQFCDVTAAATNTLISLTLIRRP